MCGKVGSAPITVGAGKCGCPGGGGGTGLPGKGGGASVAMLVDGSTVSVEFSALAASLGGDGGIGGDGGDGATGAHGSATGGDCCHKGGCTGNLSACYYANTKSDGSPCGKPISGKPAGGQGGDGGKGAKAGGGSGGPSVSVVKLGVGRLTIDLATTVFQADGGGIGADGAVPGMTTAGVLAL